MPTTRRNTCEGPASQTPTVYTALGGDTWGQINLGGSAQMYYDATMPFHEMANSLRFMTAASSSCSVQWSNEHDLSTLDFYDRFYFRVNAIPTVAGMAIRAENYNNYKIGINTSGNLYLTTNVATYTGTYVIQPNQWYRVEHYVRMQNTTGYLQVRLYVGDSITTVDYISTPSNQNMGSGNSWHLIGHTSSGAYPTLWISDWTATTYQQGFLGPAPAFKTFVQNSMDCPSASNGVDITPANSSGPFDTGFTKFTPGSTGQAYMRYSNLAKMSGTYSMQLYSYQYTATLEWSGWDFGLKPSTVQYLRLYVYFNEANPLSFSGGIAQFSGSLSLAFEYGKFLLRDAGGNVVCQTTSNLPSGSYWYRVEVKIVAGSSGTAEIRAYIGDQLGLVASGVSGTFSNIQAFKNFMIFTVGPQYLYLDNIALSSTGWIGPYVPPAYKSGTETVTVVDSHTLTIAQFKNGTDVSGLLTESVTDIKKMTAKSSTDLARFAERTIPNVPRPVDWKTEIALVTSPNVVLPDQQWTNISDFVLETAGTSLRRGRSDEMSEIQPSSLSLTVDNTDGRFTPGYTGGPHGANVDIGKMIRRSAVIDGVSYPRFTGYIDTINIPDWANSDHFHRVVTIEASDRLARIAAERAGPMLSAYEYEMMALDPELFYPLTEAESATSLSNRSTYRFDPLVRVQNAGETTLGGGEPWPAEVIKTGKFEPVFQDNGNLLASSDWFRGELRNPIPYSGGNAVTLCAWVTVDTIWTTGTLNLLPRIVQLGSDTNTLYLGLNSAGMWTGGAAGASASTAPISPGTGTGMRFVAVVINPGAPVKLYVDGVAFTGSTAPNVTDQLYTVNVGGPWAGSIGGVAVLRRELTSTQVQRLYQAGYAGTDGMLSDEAMNLVATYAGIDSTEIVIDPPRGQTRIGKIPLHGRSRLDVMKDIVRAENGLLFADVNGVLKFHTRGKRWNTGEAQLIIPPQEIRTSLAITYDDSHVINEAYVTRDGGVTARAVWAPSQTDRGIYSKQEDGLKFFSDAEAMPRARGYVIQNSKPKPRMGSLPLQLNTSLIQKYILQLDIGSIISLSGLSPDAPNFGRHFVESISESQSLDDYTITITTSPVYTPLMAYMVVGYNWLSQVGGYSYIAP